MTFFAFARGNTENPENPNDTSFTIVSKDLSKI